MSLTTRIFKNVPEPATVSDVLAHKKSESTSNSGSK